MMMKPRASTGINIGIFNEFASHAGLDLAVHNQAAYNNDDPLEAVDSAETIGIA